MNFRKIAAGSNGKVLLRYFTEDTPQPIHPPALDAAGRQLEEGGRLTAYYTGRNSRATWRADMPALIAKAVGIDARQMPTDQALTRLFEGRRADNGDAWSAQKRKLSGFDLVFSPHKSITLAAEFAATPAESAAYWNAVDRAADRAMRYVAQELGWARKGRGGEDGADPGAVGWVSFRHSTARPTVLLQDGRGGETYLADAPVAGDPHMHVHNFLFNVVATPDGRIGSLDTKGLTEMRVKEFGAYFQAVLADELRRLGVATEYDANEQAVVMSAIPEVVSKSFSKGRAQVVDKAKRFAQTQGLVWDDLSADAKMDILRDAGAEGRLGKMKADEKRLWQEQAKALGWKHTTALEGITYEQLTDDERFDRAYRFAARHLAEEFKTAATITHEKLGLYAARGLIGAGIAGGPDDIRQVVELLEERGIKLRGEHVALITGVLGGLVRVTNSAQIRIEQQVTAIARQEAKDRSGALPAADLRAAIERSGVRFTDEQRAAIYALGQGGRLAMLTGVAGAGKTTLLQPLVDAWQSDRRFDPAGRQVIGVAMAWRQADALQDANIRTTYALSPLLAMIERGELQASRNTVLIIDEASQIGPRPMLKLLELQAKTGMTIKMLGDQEQAQAIEAGDTIELLRRALPDQALPKLLTSRRQGTQRARRIAGLFRGGNAAEALTLKQQDGHAWLVGGDRGQVVAQIADHYLLRRDLLMGSGDTRGVTISAPTNDDVAEISRAVRERLRARGEIRGPDHVHAAMDHRAAEYDLAIAEGDRLRLFRRTWGKMDGRLQEVGNNGDIVTVLALDAERVRLSAKDGRVADVEWCRLSDEGTNRLLVGYGHALTIDAAQGITSAEHINALPRGTAGVTGFTAYVAESRAVGTTWTMISEGALHEAVRHRQALGESTPITTAALWRRAAEEMSQKPYKGLGIDLLGASMRDREHAVDIFIAGSQRLESAVLDDAQAGSKAIDRFRAAAASAGLARQIDGLTHAMAENERLARDVGQLSERNAHLRQLHADAAEAARLLQLMPQPAPEALRRSSSPSAR